MYDHLILFFFQRRNLQKHAKYPHIFYELASKTDKPQEVRLEAKIVRGKTNEMEGLLILQSTKSTIILLQ